MSKVNASDAAKKLARDNNLDLGEIDGTGKDGSVTKPDVEKALEAKATPPAEGDQAPPTGDTPADDLPTVTDGPTPADDQAEARAAAAEAEADETPEPPKSGEIREIDRVSDNENGAWWCPFCDHSQTPEINICQGCGATYIGDGEVQAP